MNRVIPLLFKYLHLLGVLDLSMTFFFPIPAPIQVDKRIDFGVEYV